MTKYRFVIALIALLVLGTTAIATGADGDPAILGQENDSETRTTFVGSVGFNFLEADLTTIGSLAATQASLGQFGIQFDKGSPTTGIVRIPGGATQFKFRIQKAGAARTQFVFLQCDGGRSELSDLLRAADDPDRAGRHAGQRDHDLPDKAPPPGGLKVTYWEIAEGR